ncbi:MAG: hypothetical protein AAF125_24905 [Chloroflexota bacterium]
MLEGRFNVSFVDVRSVAPGALRHRMLLNFEAMAEGVTTDQIIANLLDSLPQEA